MAKYLIGAGGAEIRVQNAQQLIEPIMPLICAISQRENSSPPMRFASFNRIERLGVRTAALIEKIS